MLRERVARPQHPRECDVDWRRSDGLLLPENERDPSVLDRIHSDAPAWRFARRSSLATDGQWRPGAWHGRHQRDISHGDPWFGRLYDRRPTKGMAAQDVCMRRRRTRLLAERG